MTPGEYKNGGAHLDIRYSLAGSPFGEVLVASTDKGICWLEFTDGNGDCLARLRAKFPLARYTRGGDGWQRLIGNWNDEKEKIEKACALAARLRSVVVVKGAHTMVVMPDGRIRFNSTGNPGMAKGGSGDVLTGLLTGLLARGYDSEQAAVTGVYYHGLAGDAAARKHGEESMNSRDLVDELKIGRFWDANDANNANARKSSCP